MKAKLKKDKAASEEKSATMFGSSHGRRNVVRNSTDGRDNRRVLSRTGVDEEDNHENNPYSRMLLHTSAAKTRAQLTTNNPNHANKINKTNLLSHNARHETIRPFDLRAPRREYNIDVPGAQGKKNTNIPRAQLELNEKTRLPHSHLEQHANETSRLRANQAISIIPTTNNQHSVYFPPLTNRQHTNFAHNTNRQQNNYTTNTNRQHTNFAANTNRQHTNFAPNTNRHHTNFASNTCLLYTSPSPRDQRGSRMPSSA